MLSRRGNGSLLLEDVVLELLEEGARAVLHLVGGPGSGKTTALRHLAAVLPGDAPVVLRDEDSEGPHSNPEDVSLVVRARTADIPESTRLVARLAPWSEDDWIEYLLAAHRDRCASVIARLRCAGDIDFLGGVPALVRPVLDELAADETVLDVRSALRRVLDVLLPGSEAGSRARVAALESATGSEQARKVMKQELREGGVEDSRQGLFQHRPVLLLLAADRVIELLSGAIDAIPWRIPADVVEEAARELRGRPALIEAMAGRVGQAARDRQPTITSLAVAADRTWRPSGPWPKFLEGARLACVEWPGAELAGALLMGADLQGASLAGANLVGADFSSASLDGATLEGADLRRSRGDCAGLGGVMASSANLSGAFLPNARLQGADLSRARLAGATLCEADLSGASLTGADLSEANLMGAKIEGTDFAGADFSGAQLAGLSLRKAIVRGATLARADLSQCDLEKIDLGSVRAAGAIFRGALLTGAKLRDADLHGADLTNAGLADLDAEGAILLEADLRGASFHLGSSRSGLVGSPIACEGSRTGFYTDESLEQSFRPPEEIRKANLRRADLRGANIEGVDFYLVDLREALYDEKQAEEFRRSGAILTSSLPGGGGKA